MQTILVIDDNDTFRIVIVKALQSRGFGILEAATVAEGIEMAQSRLPDLILSDVNMGDGDGYTTLGAVRRNPLTAAIPFIMMTGRATPEGIRKGMDEGADDYLAKPFTPHALFATVEARLKKQQAHLEHEERTKGRLVAILEATTDLVAIVDAKTRIILYLNHAGRAMIGKRSDAELAGFRLIDFQPAWAARIVEDEGIPEAIRHGVWTGETAFMSSGGEAIPVSHLIQAHKTADGSVEFLSIIARDITDRKEAEEQRQQMEMQLRQGQKLEAIGHLASGIAHEINTPTQFIEHNLRFMQNSFAGVAETLTRYDRLLQAAKAGAIPAELIASVEAAAAEADIPYLLKEIPNALDEAIHGTGRVAKIVRAMKEFSHPGTHDEKPVPSDLNHLIESTITVAANEWKYLAEMITDLDPNLPQVPLMVGEFNQVILNLLVNAAHAIGDVVGDGRLGKGTIRVSTRRDGPWAEVKIRDTGTGIPEKVRHRIFDPFFTTKAVGKGTGQGLAIARTMVVEKHRGQLYFETETGRGTCFIIRLPLNGRGDPAQAEPERLSN